MNNNSLRIGIVLIILVVIAGTAYVFLAPFTFDRVPGVRIGGQLSDYPDETAYMNDVYPAQLKVAGFPPFVVNIRHLATDEGIISWTRADNGYWARRVRGNPNGWIRIADQTFALRATEIFGDEKLEMIQLMSNTYGIEEDRSDWEVFFWLPR